MKKSEEFLIIRWRNWKAWWPEEKFADELEEVLKFMEIDEAEGDLFLGHRQQKQKFCGIQHRLPRVSETGL